MYALRVKKISVENESGDVVVSVVCHLSDTYGIAFKNSNGELDVFTVRAPKSSLPVGGYLSYLEGLAANRIAYKYSKTFSAKGTHNSPILELAESDLASLFKGLSVSGPGISSTLTLDSVISSSEVLLSGDVVLEHTGNTSSPTLNRTGDTSSGSNIINNVSSTLGVVEGMVVSGWGIPSGATVISLLSSISIAISQNALSSQISNPLTFSVDSNSLYVTNLSPAIFTDQYEGLSVSGTNIPKNTTIAETISSSSVRLSQNATGSATGGAIAIGSPASYFFDASSLSVDYSELQKVVDIIDFSNL